MSPSLASEIRDHLARYVEGELSLSALDEWFVPATWDVDRTADRVAIDLTYEIVLRLAEYSNGDCTEQELKALLRPLSVLRGRDAVSA